MRHSASMNQHWLAVVTEWRSLRYPMHIPHVLQIVLPIWPFISLCDFEMLNVQFSKIFFSIIDIYGEIVFGWISNNPIDDK